MQGWYPGHVAKARRLIDENLRVVDCVVEVLDARIPRTSRHPEMPGLVRGRPVVLALNKADLADPDATQAWVAHYRRGGQPTWAVAARSGRGVDGLRRAVREASKPALERLAARGRRPRAPRLLVVGLPNVGKSSLINRLAGRAAARTGDRPGVTRGAQWIRIGDAFELLDVPGVLWPRLEDSDAAYRLAVTGALGEPAYEVLDVARWLVGWFCANAPDALRGWGDAAEARRDPDVALAGYAAARGLRIGGGGVPLDRAAEALVRDYRAGRLGRLTLDGLPPP